MCEACFATTELRLLRVEHLFAVPNGQFLGHFLLLLPTAGCHSLYLGHNYNSNSIGNLLLQSVFFFALFSDLLTRLLCSLYPGHPFGGVLKNGCPSCPPAVVKDQHLMQMFPWQKDMTGFDFNVKDKKGGQGAALSARAHVSV